MDDTPLPTRSHRVGFACYWGREREATWSGTPYHLLRALESNGPVVDLNVALPRMVSQPMRVLGARHEHGNWRSQWRHSQAALSLVDHRLQKLARQRTIDSVLQIGDLGGTTKPFVIYQDLSYRLLREQAENGGTVPHFRTLRSADLERLESRQDGLYRRSSGLIAMSTWLAGSMARSGVAPDLIHVIPPGMNAAPTGWASPPVRRAGKDIKLLFVGRDFDTKAGDQVVAAYKLLQRENRPISLTVAGPKTWPLTEMPPGVTFLGPVPLRKVGLLLDTHDLFVMPSRFEGFGITFIEALARGLPCIGRRACAMPEIIDERAGRLVGSEDPEELADVIWSAVQDDNLFQACADSADERRAFYTWDRAAKQVREVMDGVATSSA